jgi:hypothetical protein
MFSDRCRDVPWAPHGYQERTHMPSPSDQLHLEKSEQRNQLAVVNGVAALTYVGGAHYSRDISSTFQLAGLHILVPRGAPQPYLGCQLHISNTAISPLVFLHPFRRVSFIYCFGLADNSIGQWSTRVGSHVPHVESFPLGLTSRYVPPR